MENNYRIAIVVSAPTQFEAPLYKKMTKSKSLDVKVFFGATDRTTKLVDPELGHPPGWDFSLTEGYNYSILPKNTRERWRFLQSEIFRRGAYDAVIVNGYMGRAPRLSFMAGFLSSIPVVLRGDTTLLYRRPLWKRLVRNIALRILFSQISAFMVTGSLAREHLIHYGVSPDKIFLFPYAVDNESLATQCQHYKKQRETIRSQLGIAQEDIVILGVLKFIPREGVFDLLKGYARVASAYSKVSLVLVGSGEQRKLLVDYIQKYKMPKVIFTGYQPYSLLPKYYAIADVFVHPGVREPWGVSVNEAMACGLPVIVSDLVGSAYDLVRDGENGFIYSGANINSLREALDRFLLSSGKHEFMGKRSLAIIKEWGYDKCLDEIKRVLLYLSERKTVSGGSNDQ